MCKDCFNLETNTGLVIYSGVGLTLCSNIKITNGEEMTSVITKIKSCLDFINNEIDITGLTSSSDCLALTGSTLKSILQSMLNQNGSSCTKIKDLQNQINVINSKLNGTGSVIKNVSIEHVNTSAISKTSTTTQDTYKVNHGLVPPKTILPYFGSESDFDSTGKGLGVMLGWAKANGQNGTINACGNFIRYECSICCNGTGGSDTTTLSKLNIPEITLPELSVVIDVTGETNEAGKHRHQLYFGDVDAGCGDCDTSVDNGEPACQTGADGIQHTNGGDGGCYNSRYIGKSGLHKHTFTGKGEGKLNGVKVGETAANLQSFSIVPKHLKAIPIQWIGIL